MTPETHLRPDVASVLPTSTPAAKYVPVLELGKMSYVASYAYGTRRAETTACCSSRGLLATRSPNVRPSAVGCPGLTSSTPPFSSSTRTT